MIFFKRLKNKLKKELIKLRKDRLEIILYHFVSSQNNIFSSSGHNVEPKVFKEQMQYLSRNFKIIPLEKAEEIIESGKDGPYASICFDDGYLSNINEAYPVLRDLRIPATVFLCPSILGNGDILWRDKIRYVINNGLEKKFIEFLKNGSSAGKYNFSLLEKINFYSWSKKIGAIKDMTIRYDLDSFFNSLGLSSGKIAKEFNLYMNKGERERDYLKFGNHTWSHPIMTCLDLEEQEKEIQKADDYLREIGAAPFSLSLPFAPYNQNTIEACQKLGYKFILDVSDEGNIIGERSGIFVLHRKMAPKTLKLFKKMI
ncbi:MAG: polysaccharide deacetylase family protein [Patescibacteria group bacterium]